MRTLHWGKAKNGRYGGGSKLDSNGVRLVSAKQEKRERVIKDELSGERAKRENAKITLAPLGLDKETA